MVPEVFLNVAVVQTDIYWENVTANLSSLEEKITAVDQPFDVLLLPEMFSTGFTMNKDAAEPMNLTTTRWMKQMAAQTGALLTGSMAIRESGNCYNRLFCVYPDGRTLTADKRHLFRMGRENEVYTRGENRLIVEWKGWKICPLICYDLRFPVWSRNTASDPFDLLIYVANWPARRSYAWNTLLRARAIENQCYVAGVNRVGADATGTEHQGDSVVLDYLGEPQLLLGNKESIKVVRISKYDLQEYRKIFPAWSDADDFRVLP
ncbi:Omega-amidase YafV [Dyadobacter sp. CECT 9275]|uniref:Omega-amidase YafV n=2 Tax=Dyadobacter helix TaxID=2822344 RepID=A0A916JJ33_9BACT|nr:Omega-amidase YafV [Dyadobacter sp. CECT 9275]